MRVLLFTVGSEGDVRPFVALAARLRAEGHDPVLAAPALYQGLATVAGVAFEPLDLDMSEVGGAVAGRHGLRHLLAFARAMGQRAGRALPGAAAAATAGPRDRSGGGRMTVEIPLPPGIERRSIDTRRGPVAALPAKPERASGKASVMVCGFMGTKEDFWQLLPVLARAGYDAWSYDHAGQHGGEFAGSGGDGPERYMTKSMAEEGCEVVEAAGAGAPVHLVGHCFGGFVARAVALAAPGLTQTLSLLSCGPNVRSAHARAMVVGIDDLIDRGGAMLMWPLPLASRSLRGDGPCPAGGPGRRRQGRTQRVKGPACCDGREPPRVPGSSGSGRGGGEGPGRRRGGRFMNPLAACGDFEALRIFLRLTRPKPLADPYPLHTRPRDLAPFLPIRFPGVASGFLVSTFAGCSRLLREPSFGPPTGEHLDALRPGWRPSAFTRCLYRSCRC